MDEFAVYYMAVGLLREDFLRSFDIIDADKNGDYLRGVHEGS